MPESWGAAGACALPISSRCRANKPPRVFSESMRAGRRFRVYPPANDLAMGGGSGKTGGGVSSMYSYIQLPHASPLRAFPTDYQMGVAEKHVPH